MAFVCTVAMYVVVFICIWIINLAPKCQQCGSRAWYHYPDDITPGMKCRVCLSWRNN